MKNSVIVKDLVLIGGGHAHVEVIRHFAMHPIAGLRITVISKDLYAPYSGMVPGLIAGHYAYDDCHIDLRRLAQFAQARLYLASATDIDLEKKVVCCEGRPPVHYDLLSINIGSTPKLNCEFAADSPVLPIKPIPEFLAGWQQLRELALSDAKPLEIAVVGGGAGGVEVALATQFHLNELVKGGNFPTKKIRFHLFSDKDVVLATHNRSVQRRFHQILTERKIVLHLGHRVSQVGRDSITNDIGDTVFVDKVIWATSASASTWLAETGLSLSERGFIEVNDTLQSVSHPDVFAVGDIADVVANPRPKSGVFAVRQGKPLANNLRLSLFERPLKPFTPQRNFLSLISTGDQFAVASRGSIPWAFAGKQVWRLKNWIDQRFMQRYNLLDSVNMLEPQGVKTESLDLSKYSIAEQEVRCGGCGAKVASSVLEHVLQRLALPSSEDMVLASGDADDAAVLKLDQKKLLVQSVDHFREFIDDPYVFGQIAANHSLGDIFAMGAEPHSALAIATVPFGLEQKLEQQLYEMLAGAEKVMSAAGAHIIGGHTGEGVETALGFSVNGLVSAGSLLKKTGASIGDAILLTKPLGTGTILAANMQAKAKGRWVEQSIKTMLQSNAKAAAIVQQHKASACTDVTGFGLLGHLVEMLNGGQLAAILNLERVPVIAGALECMQLGVFSSLQQSNANAIKFVANAESFKANMRLQLLADPQTCGGLLACVGANEAESCLSRLHEQGYSDAALIGHIGNLGGSNYRVQLDPS